jgi:5'(3')-deoxyribonucleotidase
MSYRVFIDMDGTLARFHAENNYLERMYEPSFFASLAPYENAVDTAAKLAEGGEAEVFVISSVIEGYPPGDCAEQKHAWLDKHLPMIDRAHRIFPPMGANKTEYVTGGVRADDVLVDDYNKNLEEWESAGGTSVKFVNDINDRGLVGKRWEGERVYYDVSAEDTAARLGGIGKADRIVIYQTDTRELIFEPYERLQKMGKKVNAQNYRRVYSGILQEGETLGDIYERFNINLPKDYKARSLSISDVVVLQRGGKVSAHYVDSVGYVDLPNFLEPAPELQEASPVIDLEELLDEAKDRIEEKAAIEGEEAAPEPPAPTVPSIKREELPKDKDELEAHLAARIETLVSDFALDPDKLMEHIRFSARFNKYSSRNLMLIAAQYPTASFVTSFSRFAKGIPDDRGVPLTDKNCSVKKGERAIYIYGFRSTEYVVDPDTGRELAVRHLSDKMAARARAEGWEKRTRTYYPLVPVFDISQTNTPPEVYPAVMGFGGTENRDADAQFRAAKNYAENVLGCSVEIYDMGERKATVRGNFTPSENAIRISSMLSGDGALSTLLHEIGHAELHADEEYLKDKPLSQIELEADMLAIMYEDHLGIAQTDARKAHLHSHYTRYLDQLRAEQGEGYDLLGKDSPFEHVVAKYQERIELFDEFQRLQEDFDLEAKATQSRAVAVSPEMKPAEIENRSAKTSGTKI